MDETTTEALQRELASKPTQFRVLGMIHHPNGNPGTALTVRAYDRDLRSEQLLGETRTNKQGYYQNIYTRVKFSRAERAAADLFVRVSREREALYDPPIDATLFNAPVFAVINIDFASRDTQVKSEYEHILSAVTARLYGVPLDEFKGSNGSTPGHTNPAKE